jgi:valyl-tRNA synthetase
MSCGLPLPKCVFSHGTSKFCRQCLSDEFLGLEYFLRIPTSGFINDKEGKKMSKSLGNVIDPHEQLDRVDSR